jgi:hypothetical protein
MIVAMRPIIVASSTPITSPHSGHTEQISSRYET